MHTAFKNLVNLRTLILNFSKTDFTDPCPLVLISKNKPDFYEFTIWFPDTISGDFKCLNPVYNEFMSTSVNVNLIIGSDSRYPKFSNERFNSVNKIIIDP